MRIIPAIDIMNGQCVRLSKGDFNTRKVYHEDPLAQAKAFEDAGIQYLHLVDLDGAKAGTVINKNVLYNIARNTNLTIDFGGGIRTDADVQSAFDHGASQVTGGSIAIQKPEVFSAWIQTWGSEKMILGADCRNRKISASGWLEDSATDVVLFIRDYETKGIEYVVCTDISRDGMLEGPALDLYKEIIASTGVKLIASGGVSCMQDLTDLQAAGCEAVIIGKAIYEGKITLEELKTLC